LASIGSAIPARSDSVQLMPDPPVENAGIVLTSSYNGSSDSNSAAEELAFLGDDAGSEVSGGNGVSGTDAPSDTRFQIPAFSPPRAFVRLPTTFSHTLWLDDAPHPDPQQDGTSVVPLPPAAWAGLSTLCGLALSRLLRRRHGLHKCQV
jgi:hypothetical protein